MGRTVRTRPSGRCDRGTFQLLQNDKLIEQVTLADMSDVTSILLAIDQGDPQAAEQLLPLVYDELRKLAAAKLEREKPGQTLQATALVHEAFLRLVGVSGSKLESGEAPDFVSRGHFFAAAATAMRRILIENARRKSRKKHGGELRRRAAAPGARRYCQC